MTFSTRCKKPQLPSFKTSKAFLGHPLYTRGMFFKHLSSDLSFIIYNFYFIEFRVYLEVVPLVLQLKRRRFYDANFRRYFIRRYEKQKEAEGKVERAKRQTMMREGWSNTGLGRGHITMKTSENVRWLCRF